MSFRNTFFLSFNEYVVIVNFSLWLRICICLDLRCKRIDGKLCSSGEGGANGKDLPICTCTYTVEPLNKGHFGSTGFVLFSEVVLWWEVQANRSFMDLIYLDNMF